MELHISKQPVVINEMAYEGSLEQSIESDVLLPDYCPDIVKILRCFLTPKISGAQVAGDKLNVDMSCIVRVYYLGADGSIRCSEQKMPYVKTCDLKANVENPVADISARTDYVHCRAVNQRRFEIRAAVTLDCRVFSRSSAETVCDAEGCGIQLKTAGCDVTELCGDVTRTFTLHEDLQLSAQKPGVQSVIRQECYCRVGDFKVIHGKVIVKGELMVRLLYQPEAEGAHPEMMEYALPVSQIVDVDGVDEDAVCDLELGVLSSEFTPKTDLEGESRMLAMDCTLKARVRTHRRQRLSLITDCYSTEYECRMERAPLSCLSLLRIVDDSTIHKCSVSLPQAGQTVIDLFCYVADVSSRVEAGAAVAVFKLMLCMFLLSDSGDITYHEQGEECEYRVPLDLAGGESVLFMPRGVVCSISYSMAGADRIECRCELAVGGCIYSLMRPRVATSITCDMAARKERGGDASLIIYYAGGGEDIWDIAKRYNTSLAAVMEENELDATSLPDKRMLLIPIV